MTLLPGHAHIIEYFWVISAAVFLCVSIRRLWRTWAFRIQLDEVQRLASSRRIERRHVSNAQQLFAKTDVHDELFRFSLGVLQIVVASVSLFLPPPPPDYLTVTQSLLIVAMSIASCWIKTLWTLFEERRERQIVAAIIDETRNAAEAQRITRKPDDND